MASVNRVILIGHLGQDPETKYMPSGDAMVNLSLATSEQWKDKNGIKQERTEWHRIVVFGKLAEICGEYLQKGKQVYFEGRIQTRKWSDRDGNDRYTTEIVADRMQMLGSKSDGESRGNGNGADTDTTSARDYSEKRAPAKTQQRRPSTAFDDIDDDIPFADPYKFIWRIV